ncbi:hypothetical protein Vretimale_11794, partial [Volvox reticuliferus]
MCWRSWRRAPPLSPIHVRHPASSQCPPFPPQLARRLDNLHKKVQDSLDSAEEAEAMSTYSAIDRDRLGSGGGGAGSSGNLLVGGASSRRLLGAGGGGGGRQLGRDDSDLREG